MNLDHYIFEILASIAGFFGGTTLVSMSKRQARLEERVNAIPEKYVPKEDYNQFTQEVRDDLKEVLRLLGSKEDRKQ